MIEIFRFVWKQHYSESTCVLLIHNLCSQRVSIVLMFMKYFQCNYLHFLYFSDSERWIPGPMTSGKKLGQGGGQRCAAFSRNTPKWSIHEVEKRKRSKSQVFIDVPWVVLFAFLTNFGYNLSETVYIIKSTSTTSIRRNKPSRWLLAWLNPQWQIFWPFRR